MEYQHPGAISPDENMLAELMLPDQTHMRNQDWTMFFLHKNAAGAEDDEEMRAEKAELKRQKREFREEQRAQGIQVDEDSENEDGEDSDDDSTLEGPPLMYVLNLVNTRHDPNEKRGAKTQAMAICTRHSFLHIYKPLLLLALEDYFKAPSRQILENLYNALNAMDLSLMPRLSILERSLLQANDVRDLFVEKFEIMIQQRLEDEAAVMGSPPASPSRQTQNRYLVPRDTREFESRIIYNGIQIPVKIPTAPSSETVGDFSLVQLVQTFNTPHVNSPQPFALHPHLTTAGAYTHPIIVLINAMLTEKRVIFLGHSRPSGEVAEAVLAACALASGGVLRGFTRHAFPYTDLSKIDELLNVPGFIAGVTNPTFSYHPEWWDVLIDLPTGRMKISSSIAPAPITEGSNFFSQQHHNLSKEISNDPTGDIAFMEDIMASIETRQGEQIIRSKFRSYISKFTRVAASFEETVYGASSLFVLPPTEIENGNNASTTNSSTRRSSTTTKSSSSGVINGGTTLKPLKGHGYVWPTEDSKIRELAATTAKIEGWRSTRSYYNFIQDLAITSQQAQSQSQQTRGTSSITPLAPVSATTAVVPHLDISHTLSRLRTLRLTPHEAAPLYLHLSAYCTSYTTILELLSHAPLQEAGLFHVSLGLWHEKREVREATVRLLERVRGHPAGRIWFGRLGGFVKVGFGRGVGEVEEGSTGGSGFAVVAKGGGNAREGE